jgi:hypothetical protein
MKNKEANVIFLGACGAAARSHISVGDGLLTEPALSPNPVSRPHISTVFSSFARTSFRIPSSTFTAFR